MKIGDVLILLDKIGYDEIDYSPYTVNKHYIIYKIDKHPTYRVGWIKDNYGNSIYFKEEEANINNWVYLKDIRKQKLNKICSVKE